MIVSRKDFANVVKKLSQPGDYGADTETTGLRRTDQLFSVIFADNDDGYYFNFNNQPDHLGQLAPEEFTLPRSWLEDLQPIVENKASTFFIHNAKFDLRMLAKEGLCVLGAVHCTEAVERVVRNNHSGYKPYSLASCAERRGWAKDESVDEYITKHKLITKIAVPGKAKLFELKHFDKVPFAIIAPYGVTDAVLHRKLGLDQLKALKKIDDASPTQAPSVFPLLANEKKFTKALFRLETTGLHCDREYTKKAMLYTQGLVKEGEAQFEKLTGLAWDNKDKTIVQAFSKFGIELPKTPTGKPCTKKEVLEDLDNPVADVIRAIRQPEKLISTYYSSFLYFADENDLVHTNMRQGGTETGRLSSSEPNIQNLPKEDEDEDRTKPFIVRKCFTPTNPDFVFVPIDFKQQEYKMLADYSGDRKLIDACNSGVDYHEATAQMLGITRKRAKTLNFGLLYGMGAAKLARVLGISVGEAYELIADYFAKLPSVQKFMNGVKDTGRARGHIWNWYGFRNHIANPEWAYVLPNHIIQGGCGQVLRLATVGIDDYIVKKRLKSTMVAQVHDEILFHVHRKEIKHIDDFKAIMEGVYVARNGIKLDCSVEHSWKSWGKWDMVSGLPTAARAA